MRAITSILYTYFTQTGRAWGFVLRTVFAGLLALWLAFRFGLDKPQWCLITVFILSHPEKKTGIFHVFTKGLFRFAGTVLGGIAAWVIVAMLNQLPLLYLLALGGWAGFCAGTATFFRGHQAYAFQLSSWSAAIILLDCFGNPDKFFVITQARLSEVALGILCSTITGLFVFPRNIPAELVDSERKKFHNVLNHIVSSLSSITDVRSFQCSQQSFVVEVINTETKCAQSRFESRDAASRIAQIRQLNGAQTELLASLQTFKDYVCHLEPLGAKTVDDMLYIPLRTVLLEFQLQSEAVETHTDPLQYFRGQLTEFIAKTREQLLRVTHADSNFIDCLLDLYVRVVANIACYIQCYQLTQTLCPARVEILPAPQRHTDLAIAIFYGLRVFGAIFLVVQFVILTTWQEGTGAILICALHGVMYGQMADPVNSVQRRILSFLISGLFCVFVLAPMLASAENFVMFSTVLIPILALFAWMEQHPTINPGGFGILVGVASALPLTNNFHFDAALFINQSLSSIVGLSFMAILFWIFSAPAGWFRFRLLRKLTTHLHLACFGPLAKNHILNYRFATYCNDILYQLITPPAGKMHDELSDYSTAQDILSLGLLIIELREAVAYIGNETLQNCLPVLLKALCKEHTPINRLGKNELIDMLDRMVLITQSEFLTERLSAEQVKTVRRCLRHISVFIRMKNGMLPNLS